MRQEDFDREFKEVNGVFLVFTVGGGIFAAGIIAAAVYIHYFA